VTPLRCVLGASGGRGEESAEPLQLRLLPIEPLRPPQTYTSVIPGRKGQEQEFEIFLQLSDRDCRI
jgi:hypothetical protein